MSHDIESNIGIDHSVTLFRLGLDVGALLFDKLIEQGRRLGDIASPVVVVLETGVINAGRVRVE